MTQHPVLKGRTGLVGDGSFLHHHIRRHKKTKGSGRGEQRRLRAFTFLLKESTLQPWSGELGGMYRDENVVICKDLGTFSDQRVRIICSRTRQLVNCSFRI